MDHLIQTESRDYFCKFFGEEPSPSTNPTRRQQSSCAFTTCFGLASMVTVTTSCNLGCSLQTLPNFVIIVIRDIHCIDSPCSLPHDDHISLICTQYTMAIKVFQLYIPQLIPLPGNDVIPPYFHWSTYPFLGGWSSTNHKNHVL